MPAPLRDVPQQAVDLIKSFEGILDGDPSTVIAKVTVQFGNGYSGKTIGSFLNVTRWSASMVPAKGYPDKGIN